MKHKTRQLSVVSQVIEAFIVHTHMLAIVCNSLLKDKDVLIWMAKAWYPALVVGVCE